MKGFYHIPGHGMAYDPNEIKIEGNKVLIKDGNNWKELQSLKQPKQSNFNAAAAGTLGAQEPFQWPAMRQLAMKNSLPEIMGIVRGLRSQPQQIRQPNPQYQNPYINNLLRYF